METNPLEEARPLPKRGLRSPLDLICEHKRAYFAINGFFYGVVLFGMLMATLSPAIRETLWKAVGHEVNEGVLAPLGKTYTSGNFLAAFAGTFFVNLIAGSFLTISIPSAIIPFSGFLLMAWRALMWGILFAPGNHPLGMLLYLHYVTLILEGQGYILGVFAAYLQGKAFLAPKTMGVETHGQGFALGLRHTAAMYGLVTVTLLVAAFYEAYLGIYIAPLLKPVP